MEKINSHYCISDKGEVYSKYINKCLSPGKNQKGYLKVTIKNDDGIKSCKFVHRLVAEHFLDNYSDNLQVNHKDENKENNHVSNLEMCDSNYNNNYGNRNTKSANTNKLGLKRKSVIQYSLSGEFIAKYESAAIAGRAINKGKSGGELIRACCKGERKVRGEMCKVTQAYGYIWKYEDKL